MDYPEFEAPRERNRRPDDAASESLLADTDMFASTDEKKAELLHIAHSSYVRTAVHIASDGTFEIPDIFPVATAEASREGKISRTSEERILPRQGQAVPDRINPADVFPLPIPAVDDLEGQRRRLAALAERALSPEHLRRMQDGMRALEARGLAGGELAQTYFHIARLLEARGDTPLAAEQRRLLAVQILENAATPTDISQGNNNTCNVTAVETAVYTRSPSIAARLVVDIALTGRYTAPGGQVVEIDPAPRTPAARRAGSREDGVRVHASEIFQIAAVNLFYGFLGNGYRYDQVIPTGPRDTGERLIDTRNNNRIVQTEPDLFDDQIVTVARLITGDNRIGYILTPSNSSFSGGDAARLVAAANNEQELNTLLANFAREGRLPVIVRVNAHLEPVAIHREDMNPARIAEVGAHVVTITAYHPGPPPTVSMDNQWSRAYDRTISVTDLWNAMQTGQTRLQSVFLSVRNQVFDLRAQGIFDPELEMRLLRLRLRFGNASNEELLEHFNWFGESHREHCRTRGTCDNEGRVREAMYIGPITPHAETLQRLMFLHQHRLVSQEALELSFARLINRWRTANASSPAERLAGEGAVNAFLDTLLEDQRTRIRSMRLR